MAKIKRECWNCGYYSAYYIKGYSRFVEQNFGVCGKSKAQIDNKRQTCEWWRGNHGGRIARKTVALNSLIEIAQNVNCLRIILEEENEMNKIDPID